MAKEAEIAQKTYHFRPYKESDIPLILSSWGYSYFKGCLDHQKLTPQEFHEYHRPLRERFFSRPTATVIVCAWNEDPNIIYGWIAVEVLPKSGLILHYVYVKESFKGERIATELLERALPERPVFFSHLTERANKIILSNQDKYQHFYYVPHLT